MGCAHVQRDGNQPLEGQQKQAWAELSLYKTKELWKLPPGEQKRIHELIEFVSPAAWTPMYLVDVHNDSLGDSTVVLEQAATRSGECSLRIRSYIFHPDGSPRSSEPTMIQVARFRWHTQLLPEVIVESVKTRRIEENDLIMIQIGGRLRQRQYYA